VAYLAIMQIPLHFATTLTLFSLFSFFEAKAQITFDSPDLEEVWDRADKEGQFLGKYLTGVVLENEMNFFDEASIEVLANGLTQWELDLFVQEAKGLSVYFNDFHIPVGGELFLESLEGAFETVFQEGPVDASENNDHGRWVSSDIPGEVVKIVYRQASSVVGEARLGIMGVGYYFRGVTRGGGSDPCEVDVMCPEGDSWQCERDAAVRLTITQGGGIYFCSGAMVNNTDLDCRQLLLTAFHCADAVSVSEWAYFKVRFNYEYLDCGGTTSVNSHNRTGVIELTNSDDSSNQGFSGSDFLLVEVEDHITSTWNPFYSGFNATGVTGHSGVGIHHPAGDRKKISNYTNPLISTYVGAPGSHWRVIWVPTETDHGVTEGGSSGSPIFDENHHIVGTLSSGASACSIGGAGGGTGPSQPDYYGKISYHWNGSNPIAELDKLKYFLNPSGSGQEILYGSYVGEGDQPCGNFGACDDTGIAGEILENKGWSMSPNPAFDAVQITMPSGAPLSELRLYDAQGRLVDTFIPSVSNKVVSIDLSSLSSGLHYITVRTTDGTSSTQKLIIE
jgi:hypothetical protein